MKTVAIIQARMGSTRLPGKVLKTVLGKTLLEFLVDRLARAKELDDIVVATTTADADDAIADLCAKRDVPVYRGSEDDVLARYFEAARVAHATTVVRMTSDCPLADVKTVDDIVSFAHNHPEFKYVTNSPEESRGERRTYPRGTDVEVFSFASLAEAHREAVRPEEREHVTTFFRRRPERYPAYHYQLRADLSHYRLTVDTPEDFELVRRVLEALHPANPDFALSDVDRVLAEHPDWAQINRDVKQKAH